MSDTLPKIKREELEKVVQKVEANSTFRNFEALYYRIAGTDWAESKDLDGHTIGQLILHHNIPTKTPKPGEEPKVVIPPPQPREAPVVPKTTPQGSPQVKVTSGDGRKTEGGLGRKKCPSCQMYVGVRSAICPCGHSFSEGKRQSSPEKLPPKAEVRPQEKSSSAREVYSTLVVMGRAMRPDPDFAARTWMAGEDVTDENLLKWVSRFREAFNEYTGTETWHSNYAIWEYCKNQFHLPAGGGRRCDPILVANADRILALLGGDDR
jgi:hypothetical protein